MPDSKPIQTNRDKYAERIKTKYPDKEYADDEALWGQVNDDYDGYDKEISEYRDREKSLSDLFTSDPRSAAFLTNWRKGGNPAVELVRMYGDDFVEELQDPDKQEELAQASKDFAERVAKEKEFDKLYQDNIKETLSTLEKIQSEEGKTDEDIDNAMEFLVNIVKDGIMGKFSKESIHMAFNAINHDSDVEIASQEGEVKGRNEKIEEKLRKRKKNDGTASLDGKNGGNSIPREMPDLGVLDRYDNNADIWERGGEKRRRMR